MPRLRTQNNTYAHHQIMQSNALKLVVGLLGCGLVAVLLFVAISKASMLDGAKAGVALLVTLKVISLVGKKGAETIQAAATPKRNSKFFAIGLAVGLLLPLVLLLFITNTVR
jgi:sulfite exporter TauE/SafE